MTTWQEYWYSLFLYCHKVHGIDILQPNAGTNCVHTCYQYHKCFSRISPLSLAYIHTLHFIMINLIRKSTLLQKRLKHRKSRLIVSGLLFLLNSFFNHILGLMITECYLYTEEKLSCRKKLNCLNFHWVQAHQAWVFKGLAGQLRVIRFGFWFLVLKFYVYPIHFFLCVEFSILYQEQAFFEIQYKSLERRFLQIGRFLMLFLYCLFVSQPDWNPFSGFIVWGRILFQFFFFSFF